MTDTKELVERLRTEVVDRSLSPYKLGEQIRERLNEAADALEAAEARAEKAKKELKEAKEAGMTDRQPQQCAENAHCSPADLSLQKVQESPEPVVRPGGGDG